MPAHATSPLEASVLVLNKLFMAVHVISVRRAFCLLCKELAEVVSLEDGQFATYNFESWREVSEFRASNFRQEDDDWVRHLQQRNSGAARHSPAGLRKAAQADGEVQPPQHFRPGQQPVPVLRPEVPDERTEPRPRRAALARAAPAPGKTSCCACVKCNVRKGGRTPKQAHISLIRKPEKPKRSPHAQPEADPQEVCVVEVVPRQCLLVRGIEVIFATLGAGPQNTEERRIKNEEFKAGFLNSSFLILRSSFFISFLVCKFAASPL